MFVSAETSLPSSACGFLYQLYDFAVIDCICTNQINSLSLQMQRSQIQNPCSCCHQSNNLWSSSSSLPLTLSDTLCLHCQLFTCEQCYSQQSQTPIPLSAMLSYLPPFRMHFLKPIVFASSCPRQPALCVLSFEDQESIQPLQSVPPLLHSLLAISGCSLCRERLDLTTFIYGNEKVLKLPSLKELIDCLPARQVILLPIRHQNPPLLKYVFIESHLSVYKNE